MADNVDTLELGTSVPAAYSGAAWRARFLRAPKISLELAQRLDFVPLQQLALIKLGLKTGADSFFFLERLPKPVTDRELVSRRGIVTVKGHDGWRGEIASADLLPAVLNPHQLFLGDGRRFAVPAETKHVYLFPHPGKQRHGLPEYVKLGELQGIHQGDLVKSNGSENAWYRQVRSLVTSEWVLPYNSAYDYGAWHNPNGAVLNGRFVGVDPLSSVDSELLGAVLNTTFAAIGRLIEGVATGVEGAFDVGPPAARKIMLPDIRRLSDAARDKILETFQKIRQGGEMIPAPLRNGSVPALRRELDSAFLVALGLTNGQAAALLERLYTGYGRWRGNIEDVETQMQANRRQMKSTGQSRNQRPAEAAGRRVWEEVEHLVPLFPKTFLSHEEILEVINVPATAVIPASEQLFETGVVRTKSKAIDLGSFERVRYTGMLRTLGLVGSVELPVSSPKAGAIADLFEKHQLLFQATATENASRYISGAEAVSEVVEIARKHWYAACRKSALAKAAPSEPKSKLN